MNTIPLVVLTGPTGIGKTQAALELAERFDAEIVGADSVQVYKYMDIGSAKPTFQELQRVAHHLIDVVYPDQPFDAARYAFLAQDACRKIEAKGKRILVVGGTGLYIKALLKGLFKAPPVSRKLRNRMKETARKQGIHYLYAKLVQVDPESAEHIHSNDLYRIIRALEVYEQTGKPISYFQGLHGFKNHPFKYIMCGLSLDREILYRQIERRVELMLDMGFLEEVEKLMNMGYGPELKSMQSIGYRHLAEVVGGKTSLKQAVTEIKKDTRRFAKRQLTWFRAQTEMKWFNRQDMEVLYQTVSKFYNGPANREE